MAYQVIARKWRPQKFDDVVGQQAVTRTLRNALSSGRLAHSFVFAGPRGVGKTTSARILARALSCVKGPTADPCGVCEPCVEIAEGRDIDVLEIDAATHTQVENVREVIIQGLSIAPVRNRYKIFIIDEVHQLSGHSFNALLKSIEEPPPHVVFMMATTELDKIPETVLSRSQVYEFRTISSKTIAEQLRRIVNAEGITVGDDSLLLVARDAEGSMRDAQSKLDQVLAFTGKAITADDVATVLGLVGRDLLIDTVQAVADEDAPAAFALAARAVDMGYDLRAVCRELSRVVRDLLVLSVDPSRIGDPEIAAEGERDRLKGLAGRYSREDLLRAFDLLTRAETDVRTAAQPRYHLEMALLRWIYLRKIVPIEDLIAGAPSASRGQPAPAIARPAAQSPLASKAAAASLAATARASGPSAPGNRAPGLVVPGLVAPGTVAPGAVAPGTVAPGTVALGTVAPGTVAPGTVAPSTQHRAPSTQHLAPSTLAPSTVAPVSASFKDALLSEIRKSKAVFYNMVVAQAQKIEFADDRVTFTFGPTQRALRDTFEQNRAWLESAGQQVAGRRIVFAAQSETPVEGVKTGSDRKTMLREQALADAGVQTLLDVFPAEIRDVEEI